MTVHLRAAADAHPADAPGRAGPPHLGRPAPQGARAGPRVGGAGVGPPVAVAADRAAAHRPRPGPAAQAVGLRRQPGVHPAHHAPRRGRTTRSSPRPRPRCCPTGRRASRTATSASCRRTVATDDRLRLAAARTADAPRRPAGAPRLQRRARHVRRRRASPSPPPTSGSAPPRRARPPTSGRRSDRPWSSAATRRAAPGSPGASATSGSSRRAGVAPTRRRPTAGSGTPTTAAPSWRALGGWRSADPKAASLFASPLANGCLLVEFHDDPTPTDEVWVGTGEGPLLLQGTPGDVLPGVGVLHAVGPSTKPETDPVFTAEATNLLGAGIYRLARQPGGTGFAAATTKGLFERPSGSGPQTTWIAATGVPTGKGGAALPCTDAVWTPPAGSQLGRLWAALLRPDSGQVRAVVARRGGRHASPRWSCRRAPAPPPR